MTQILYLLWPSGIELEPPLDYPSENQPGTLCLAFKWCFRSFEITIQHIREYSMFQNNTPVFNNNTNRRDRIISMGFNVYLCECTRLFPFYYNALQIRQRQISHSTSGRRGICGSRWDIWSKSRNLLHVVQVEQIKGDINKRKLRPVREISPLTHSHHMVKEWRLRG